MKKHEDATELTVLDLANLDKNDPSIKRKQETMQALMETVPMDYRNFLVHANHLHIEGKTEEAINEYKEIAVRCPNSAFVLFCLGTAYCNVGEQALGIICLMRSVELFPSNSEGWNNLGSAFKVEHQDVEAAECFHRSAECDPDCASTYANLSGVYINNGVPDKAIEYARKALQISNGRELLPQAHNHLALALLEKGEFDEGFKEWEWRRMLPEWPGRNRDFSSMERWNGEYIDGKLLIVGEQGVGDEILFAQCINDVTKSINEEQLVIEVNHQVAKVFERTWPKAKVYVHFDEAKLREKPTHYIELGSLATIYRRNWPDDFDGRPYMKVDEERVRFWRKRLEATGPGPYIGFSWRGGVKKTARHLREFPLEKAKPLIGRKGTFVSVQYGPHATEATTMGLPHWPEQAFNLDDRYHLIAACDLIMTVCQTTFHQAGSIGKPVWCFVPSRPAWRYNLRGEESVWYDSAVLLRQRNDDWGGLLHRAGVRYDRWLREWRKDNEGKGAD